MDYAELYLWDIPVVWSKPESGDRELISLRDRTPRIAAEGCDIEALIHSEMGRQMVLQFEDYIRYGDEMDPGLCAEVARAGSGQASDGAQ